MKDLVVWLVHTPAGTVAFLSAIAAFGYSKGSWAHRRSGRYFTVSMLIMAVSGSLAGFLKGTPNDVFLGLMVFYSVFTAWLTTFHKEGETDFLEYIALAWVVTLGLIAFSYDPSEGEPYPEMYALWVGLAIFFAVGDIRNLYKRGLSGSQRIARHLWRMCFSLMWAAMAFVDKIVKMTGATIEEMPYVAVIPMSLILILTIYWLHRVFRSRNSVSI